MLPLKDSLYVGLQCAVGRGNKPELLNLNPGQTFKIKGIIQEIMRTGIIVFIPSQRLPVNMMLTWLHKAGLPGHPEALYVGLRKRPP
jgi:hypothetical protein